MKIYFEKRSKNYFMADIKKLIPIVAQWEGGFVNDKTDRGGATNMGVTIGTWKSIGYDKDGDGDIDVDDLKILTTDDFKFVLQKYWNRWRANEIVNQSIANLLVDWVYTSGAWGIKIPQRVLKTTIDGVVGPKTLSLINGHDPKILFGQLYAARAKFFDDIVANDPSQKKFIKGWKRRLAFFKFIPE